MDREEELGGREDEAEEEELRREEEDDEEDEEDDELEDSPLLGPVGNHPDTVFGAVGNFRGGVPWPGGDCDGRGGEALPLVLAWPVERVPERAASGLDWISGEIEPRGGKSSSKNIDRGSSTSGLEGGMPIGWRPASSRKPLTASSQGITTRPQ